MLYCCAYTCYNNTAANSIAKVNIDRIGWNKIQFVSADFKQIFQHRWRHIFSQLLIESHYSFYHWRSAESRFLTAVRRMKRLNFILSKAIGAIVYMLQIVYIYNMLQIIWVYLSVTFQYGLLKSQAEVCRQPADWNFVNYSYWIFGRRPEKLILWRRLRHVFPAEIFRTRKHQFRILY